MLFPMPSEQSILIAMLIFLRVSALMMLIPVLGHKLVPQTVKAGLVLVITFLLYPIVSQDVSPIKAEPLSFILLAVQEMLFAGGIVGEPYFCHGSICRSGHEFPNGDGDCQCV